MKPEIPENTDVVAVIVAVIFGVVGWITSIWQYVTRQRRERREESRRESLIVRKLLRFLENRKVLYSPISFEVPSECVASVLEIRTRLQAEIESLEELDHDTGALQPIQSMQAACRAFLDRVRDRSFWTGIFPGAGRVKDLEDALANLRAVFDEQMEKLYEEYEVKRGERPIDYGPIGEPMRIHHDVPMDVPGYAPPGKTDQPGER